MHVTGFQFDIAWEDRPANYGAVREAIRTAEIPPGG